MSQPDVPIVMIEAAPDAKVEKKPGPHPSSYGYCPWKIDVIYILEDGQRIPGTSRHGRKRDATAYLASLPGTPVNPMKACFNDDGEFWGTTTSFDTIDLLTSLGQGKVTL